MMDFGDVLLDQKSGRRKRRRNPLPLLVGAVAVIAAVAMFRALFQSNKADEPVMPPVPVTEPAPQPKIPAFRTMVYPTSRTNLNSSGEGLQSTASGRPESGGYGSVRTGRYHEGVDIAATGRDRAGRPLDQVMAAAGGTVGYINRVAGNSNYGIYILLLHDDPIGTVYSLYAHLSKVEPGLAAGSPVEAGTVIGTMGNTPASIIPAARGHLHFEIGLILNSRFGDWFRSQKLVPDHGMFNGKNLLAIDPLAVFAAHERNNDFSMLDHIRTLPRAFEVVVKTSRQPDFFRRYPDLWDGPAYVSGPVVLACTPNGLPLSGRNATPAEAKSLARNKMSVLNADASVLGANGSRIVEPNGKDRWKPGFNATRWMELLTY